MPEPFQEDVDSVLGGGVEVRTLNNLVSQDAADQDHLTLLGIVLKSPLLGLKLCVLNPTLFHSNLNHGLDAELSAQAQGQDVEVEQLLPLFRLSCKVLTFLIRLLLYWYCL